MKALAGLGWTPGFAQALRDLGDSSLIPARLAVEHRRGYAALYAEKDQLHRIATLLPGRLRRDLSAAGETLAVGDWLAVRPGAKGLYPIAALLPRRNAFSRRMFGKNIQKQILAANLDRLFIAMAADDPFDPRRLEHYLAACAKAAIAPTLLLTKADLIPDRTMEARIAAVRRMFSTLPTLALSLVTGQGVTAVRRRIAPTETVAVIGASGVGKSSLINRLLGQEQQRTASLSDRGQGRHTTTRRELLPLPRGGILLDTPGIRSFHLWEADPKDVFPEIEALSSGCRFRDCRHRREPGCAVLMAIAEGRLDPARLAAFHRQQAALAGDKDSERKKARPPP